MFVVGKRWDEVREDEKGRVSKEAVGNGLLQSEWFLFPLILPNFMIAKGLINVNVKCVFRGELCRVMMKLKSSPRYFF